MVHRYFGFNKKQNHFILDFIDEGDFVFDVGANIGGKTDIFRRKGARVLCIEPQPDCA